MFARHYWPRRFFAPRYWPQSQGQSPTRIITIATIEAAIQTLLLADTYLNATPGTVPIYIEEDFLYGLQDSGSAIVIYADRRDPHPDQVLNEGKTKRWLVRFSIWVRSVAMDIQQAAKDRTAVLAKLHFALNSNHTLNGTVDSSWMEGGDLTSAKSPQSGQFMMSAETVLMADFSTGLA